mgnify:CR=1 FL=1
MKNSLDFIKTYISNNDKIVIGVSGGADSMCLLEMLKISIPFKNIICAHINHNIREESKSEEKFVKDYCLKNKIIFETITFDKGKYNESELRKKRYQFFDEIVNKYQAKYLLTAHHGDDLVETILMRLTRGSNLKGYVGIELISKRKNYQILRPLLYVTKEEISEYNKTNNIKYVTDVSNFKDDYTRNRYRHNILPFIKNENKNVHLKYLKFSSELLEYYNYVEKIVKNNIKEYYSNGVYNLESFKNQDSLIKRKIIEEILRLQYIDNLELITDKHVQSILILINKSNGILNFPSGLIIEKSYKKLIFTYKKNELYEFDYILDKYLSLPFGDISLIDESDDNSNFCIKLDSREITFPLHVRTRKNGDRIKVKNLNGTKKVKDILIDEKVPINEREKIIILTDNEDNILWIPGIKKSSFDKSEIYDIIIKYLLKKEK